MSEKMSVHRVEVPFARSQQATEADFEARKD